MLSTGSLLLGPDSGGWILHPRGRLASNPSWECAGPWSAMCTKPMSSRVQDLNWWQLRQSWRFQKQQQWNLTFASHIFHIIPYPSLSFLIIDELIELMKHSDMLKLFGGVDFRPLAAFLATTSLVGGMQGLVPSRLICVLLGFLFWHCSLGRFACKKRTTPRRTTMRFKEQKPATLQVQSPTSDCFWIQNVAFWRELLVCMSSWTIHRWTQYQSCSWKSGWIGDRCKLAVSLLDMLWQYLLDLCLLAGSFKFLGSTMWVWPTSSLLWHSSCGQKRTMVGVWLLACCHCPSEQVPLGTRIHNPCNTCDKPHTTIPSLHAILSDFEVPQPGSLEGS